MSVSKRNDEYYRKLDFWHVEKTDPDAIGRCGWNVEENSSVESIHLQLDHNTRPADFGSGILQAG